MSKQGTSRSSTPQRKGHPLLAGILIGMVVGLLVAGGMAWYILKTPSPFVNNVPHETTKLEPDAAKPAPPKAAAATPESAQPAASGVDGDKPRFEFYKVLTDNQAAPPAAPKAADKPASETKPAAKEAFFLQAGAFTDASDADRLKARLAMLGAEATVLDATLPDKTELHRVRLGPYKSAEEMNKAAAMLKQNGITTTPMRSQ